MEIHLTATVESLEQAKQLLEAGVDTLYFGGGTYGLRLPHNFSLEEQRQLVELAHTYGKRAVVAVNAIMHPEKMLEIKDYLDFLQEIKVDAITVGDTGVIHVLRRDGYNLPFIYDGHTMVTSARQMNFWAKRGAIGSVVAREVPYLELCEMKDKLIGFGEILVYGASCIHQSKRPLVENYLNFVETPEQDKSKESNLFLSEPRKGGTHYSIYEDEHGTHIFANNDVNLMVQLDALAAIDFHEWKLEGIYTPGETFVEIAKLFIEARDLLVSGQWTVEKGLELNEKVKVLHPEERDLDSGFFLMSPEEVK
ncbi:peptidase U32 family protein [Vagococcus zengguangii]|uniref:U32 family peptidase n=1 Tax=Vagococcus zengguangii TaxID=2571750 RepID=A0A4D7CNF4_9ENTE|nr:peptidase U32 family protein [Vagococcus zengguangii]QCI85618.1 U32 family peptidase [Vagococcus zengguangii]TLG79569.1 U32 family peptidase [Vagococcus zengguangii]